MRSQLDCVDKRLPGTGVFDIKTRACLPVRMDILNWEVSCTLYFRVVSDAISAGKFWVSDQVCARADGKFRARVLRPDSVCVPEIWVCRLIFEIQCAYGHSSMQVRIGDMDGVIVAYHNTARLFGFQYVSLEEMDRHLFGPEPGAGDRVFQKCVGLLECIAPEIVQCFPGQASPFCYLLDSTLNTQQSVKATFECEEGSKDLNVWVQPAEWESTVEQVEPPIRQLCIQTQSFLSESNVNGSRAINGSSTMPCQSFL